MGASGFETVFKNRIENLENRVKTLEDKVSRLNIPRTPANNVEKVRTQSQRSRRNRNPENKADNPIEAAMRRSDLDYKGPMEPWEHEYEHNVKGTDRYIVYPEKDEK